MNDPTRLLTLRICRWFVAQRTLERSSLSSPVGDVGTIAGRHCHKDIAHSLRYGWLCNDPYNISQVAFCLSAFHNSYIVKTQLNSFNYYGLLQSWLYKLRMVNLNFNDISARVKFCDQKIYCRWWYSRCNIPITLHNVCVHYEELRGHQPALS